MLDEAGALLRCGSFWKARNLAVTNFEKETLGRTFKRGIGLPGRVWSALEPSWVTNVTTDTSFRRGPVAKAEGLRGAFAFPILSGSKFLGVMEFFSRAIREPDQPLLAMVATIGGQLGQFMQRKRAEAALQSNLTERNLLYRLMQAVNQARALPEIYEAALDAIIQVSECDRASILFFDESKVMRFKAWRGLSKGYRRAVGGHSPWKGDEPDPQPILIEDAGRLEGRLRGIVQDEGIGALGFVPIAYEGQLLGKFMIYYNRRRRFQAEALRVTQAIASQVAFAVQRRRGQEQLESLVRERTTSCAK